MTLPIPYVEPHAAISEADFQEQVRRALNAPGRTTRFFRVNVGAIAKRNRAGKVIGRFSTGAVTGAADLSGIASVEIEGVRLGLRVECEMKVDHAHTPEQIAYGEMITKFGGVYLVCRYDHALTLSANVAAAVAAVDAAIAARVSATKDES